MAEAHFKHARVAGIAGAVPSCIVHADDFLPQVGEKVVQRVKAVTGIREVRRSPRRQTASDLGFAAAERLLNEKGISREEIGAIVNVTEFPDYVAPSTAFVLHKRLRLSQSCIAFDVNLGCTGYVYGLHIACSLLQASQQKYVLLIVGDVPKNNDFSRREKPDHGYLMMFGDAGTATLLEKSDGGPGIRTELYADGTDFKLLYTLGGARCADASREVTRWSDGVDRSLYDSYMDGMGVFSFSTTVAPRLIKKFLQEQGETPEDYAGFYLHQANKMIVERVAKLAKLPLDKVPLSLTHYGNTNCGTVPVTIVDQLGNFDSAVPQRLFLCGFGVGLSWGVATMEVSPADVLPMLETDEFYAEGEVQPF